MLDFAQHHALLCYDHATYCLFELVSRAKQENLSWSNVSFILRELQLLVRSCAFCRVSSEIKKYNLEMKKSLRQTILVRATALHGESFCWAAVPTEYKLLMQICKSTQHALDLHSKMSSECDVTLELYRSCNCQQISLLGPLPSFTYINCKGYKLKLKRNRNQLTNHIKSKSRYYLFIALGVDTQTHTNTAAGASGLKTAC